MKLESNPLLLQKEWRFINHASSGLNESALKSFAYDDTFCTSVGSGESAPIFRTWLHSPTIVLGIQDSKLPFLEQGIDFLKRNHYQVIMRNSGGLAVVLDGGVVNFSLILPEGKGIDINRGYEAMWNFISFMFADYPVTIEAKEIVGSYCPGSFDLSIKNKKFAGISQRRLRGGVAVQIYLCVTGSGSQRAELIRDFYEIALANKETKVHYPKVIPDTVAALTELIDKNLSVSKVILLAQQTLNKLGSNLITTQQQLTVNEEKMFNFFYDRIIIRNEKAFL